MPPLGVRKPLLGLNVAEFPAAFAASNETYRYSKSRLDRGNAVLVRTQHEYCDRKAIGHLEHLRDMNLLLMSDNFLSLLADALKLDARLLPPKGERYNGDAKGKSGVRHPPAKEAAKLLVLLGAIAGDGDLPLPVKLWLHYHSGQAVAQAFDIDADETSNFEANPSSSISPHAGATGVPTPVRLGATTGTTHEHGSQSNEPVIPDDLAAPSAAVIETGQHSVAQCAEVSTYDDSALAIPDHVLTGESSSLPLESLGEMQPYSLEFLSWMSMAALPTSLGTYPPLDSLQLDSYADNAPTEVSPAAATASGTATQSLPAGHLDACQRVGVVGNPASVVASLAAASDSNILSDHAPPARLVDDSSLPPSLLREDDATPEMPAIPPAPESRPLHERPLSDVAPDLKPDLSANEISAILSRLPAFDPNHDSDFDEDFDDVPPPAPPPRHVFLPTFWVNTKTTNSVDPSGGHGAVSGLPKQLRNTIEAPSTTQHSQAGRPHFRPAIGHVNGDFIGYPHAGPAYPYDDAGAQGNAVLNPSARRLDTQRANDTNGLRYNSNPHVFNPAPQFRRNSMAVPSAPLHSGQLYSSSTEQNVPRQQGRNNQLRRNSMAVPSAPVHYNSGVEQSVPRQRNQLRRNSMAAPSAPVHSAPFYNSAVEHNIPRPRGRRARKRDATDASIGYGDPVRPAPAARSHARHLHE